MLAREAIRVSGLIESDKDKKNEFKSIRNRKYEIIKIAIDRTSLKVV
ncbi:MAG: hypothetical protein IKY58_02035 [Paludibacteraceae bacterium]|nr:hypothetical protein [Paludibacteraceae bacterium]